MVVARVAGVTSGLVAPGVQAGSGSTYCSDPLAWHDAGASAGLVGAGAGLVAAGLPTTSPGELTGPATDASLHATAITTPRTPTRSRDREPAGGGMEHIFEECRAATMGSLVSPCHSEKWEEQ